MPFPSDTTPTKSCKSCSLVKPLTEFYVNRRMPDGRQFYCKECLKAKVRKAQSKAEDRKLEAFMKHHGITIHEHTVATPLNDTV